MLTLYRDHNAVCCHKVELVLAEKGLDFETVTVPLFRSAQYDPDYLLINPRGVVPTLVHDGATIIESTVICEYVDETFPAPPLMPGDPAGRAQVRQWTKLVDEEIHEAGSVLSFCAMFRDRMLVMEEAEREERVSQCGQPGPRGLLPVFGRGWRRLAFRVQSGRPPMRGWSGIWRPGWRPTGSWLAGGRYSLAEAAVTPYFARAKYLGLLDIWIAGRPATAAWWGRIQSRASFAAVLTGTLSNADLAEMSASGDKIRTRVEARRDEYLHAYASRLVGPHSPGEREKDGA